VTVGTQPLMSEVEQATLLGFLAGYRGYTRDAYTLDLRQFTAWCWQRQHRLFEARRVDIECFARDRNDLGAIVVTAGLSSPRDHALMSLLALNGLQRLGSDRCQHPWTVTMSARIVGAPSSNRVTAWWQVATVVVARGNRPRH
jgi:hypothetical protein